MTAPTILVADDDEVVGMVLSRVLTRQGYSVMRTLTCSEAVEAADRQPPQLALLDLCLPDGDGVSLADDLRQRLPAMPLILVTAYPLLLRERPELAARFARVLTKPVNLSEFRRAVEETLNQETAEAEAEETAASPKITVQCQPRVADTMSPLSGMAVACVIPILLGLAGIAVGLSGNTPRGWRPYANAAPAAVQVPGAALVKGSAHTLTVPVEANADQRTSAVLPPVHVVEVPYAAILEDGKQSVVFVQSATKPTEFTLRRVVVVRRLEGTVFVRSRPIDEHESLTPLEDADGLLPRQPLLPSERVLVDGVRELKATLDRLETDRRAK